jgi:alpha-L-rhamnosidase
VVAVVAVGTVGTVVAVGTGGTMGWAAPAAASPAPRWPAHVDWERDVVAPATTDVVPLRVIATSGTTTGAKTLTDPTGGGRATLTMRPGGRPPTIVVDYGKDVGGLPYFVVRSVSGSPVLRSTYSEGLQYLGPDGDATRSASAAGDPSRVDDLTLAYPGTVSTGLIQGGERYERISLASPGTVTLSSLGIRFAAVRAPAHRYRGWFDSSSPELNRIWFDGAYTTQLDELPARTVPPPWRITGGALDATGGSVGLLRPGLAWTDDTLSFDTRVVDNETGWIVRAPSPASGYLIVLHASTKPGAAATLQEIAIGPGVFTVIGTAALPPTFVASQWHHVTTTVSGADITTSVEGHPVDSFATDSLPPGTPVYRAGTDGFAALGSAAMFRDLVVTGPDGTTLYANRLSSPSALAAFTGPDITTTNPLPVIMDGAKRDRVVWSGDLGVEAPNVFDTTDASRFVRGSLRLLASYQVADGETGTNVDPTLPLGTFPQPGSTYSTSYSMDEVDNIATYYLYTGDLAFVRSEWPVITRELAYNQSLVDARGLLVTDEDDGQDWDYYDGEKTGEVTAYNDIYYRTLTDAASLADALGLSGEAATYTQRAVALRTAINRYLRTPATGLYALSNLLPTAVAQDGTSLAVLFGVAPPADDPAIMDGLRRTLPSTPYGPLPFTANAGYRTGVSPFVTNVEVDALFAVGDTAAALDLIETLWGHMDAPGPDDTDADWELVGRHGAPGFGERTSLAHGWSSGATADLSADVLGVQPLTAAFATWSVHPHPGPLAWAEGQVPTPHGTVAVHWAQDTRSGRFALQVTVPARTEGTITVPVPRSGAAVTVTTTPRAGAGPGRPGRSRRVLSAPPDTTSLSFTATGGATYDVDVAPR